MAQVKRIFLDANILFTASHNPEGLASTLIQRFSSLKLEIFTSEYALEEARYNLTLKFPQALLSFEKITSKLEIVAVQVDEKNNPLNLPLDELPIYQGALACKADFLITGDKKAFGKWMNKIEKTEGLLILTPTHISQSFSSTLQTPAIERRYL